jgi:hypothetical protein
MGVAFYSVLEYEQWDAYWALGQLNIPRDPELFSAIAFGDGGETENMPYPPRGLPSDCSSESRELFFTDSDEVKEYLDTSRLDGEEELSLEEYVEGFGEWALIEYQTNGHLPVPETYNHSWLNLSELKESLAFRNLSNDKLSPAFRAVLAAMEELAKEYGAGKVRLVFGFGM